MLYGWGGRSRTYGTRYQKALPYHLATPQQHASYTKQVLSSQDNNCVIFTFILTILPNTAKLALEAYFLA